MRLVRLPGGIAQILRDDGHTAPTLGNKAPGRTESGWGENKSSLFLSVSVDCEKCLKIN